MRDFINKPQAYFDAIEEDRLGQIRHAIEENDIKDYSELMQYAAEHNVSWKKSLLSTGTCSAALAYIEKKRRK